MRPDPPQSLPPVLAPLLFVLAYASIGLAWAMTQPAPGAEEPGAALRSARLGDLALWLLAVALATVLTWRPASGSLALAGLALALTPAVVFLGAAGGGEGLVVGALIAVLAGALRLSERPRPPAWAYAATALTVLLLALSGPELPRPGGIGELVGDAWRALGPGLATATGRFAPADVTLPPLGFVIWALALLALVLAADRRTDDRGRRLLWGGSLLALLAALLLHGAARAQSGASLAIARQPLALLAFVPLCAGWLLARAGAGWWPRLGAGCFGLIALVQLLGFLAMSSDARAAGGASPWLAAVLAGAAALAAAGAITPTALPRSDPQGEPGIDWGKSGPKGGATPQAR